MNTNILTKCINELQKDSPDLSYLRGMLETLLEMQDKPDPWDRVKSLVDNGTTHATYDGEVKKTSYPSLSMSPKLVTPDTPEGMAVEMALANLQGPKPKLDSLTIEKNITLN